MSNTIWLYWEGVMPPYIALCHKTVLAHNQPVTLLDWAGFDALFTTDRDIELGPLAPNHRSDFIRAYLLQHYGGLYLDADCVVLHDLAPVLDLARQHGFVGYRQPQGYMSCNFMASLPGSAVMADHYAQLCATLRSHRPLEWLDLASWPMDAAVMRHLGKSHLLSTQVVMPIDWTASEQFCVRRSDDQHAQHLESAALCYMLSNNTIHSRHTTRILSYMPEAHLLNEHFFFSYLLRKSLRLEELQMVEGPSHLGGHENLTQFDEGAFDYLATRFQVKSMVDVGCGLPGMVYYALSKDIRAIGVDGDPTIAHTCPAVIEHDYAGGPLYLGEFDLGWSVEFVEHVEERYIANFMRTFQGCQHVFITAAVPGQPGYHHVNCQPSDYWIRQFEVTGFVLDHEATEGVRQHSSMWSRFTQNTGLVFTRTSHP